MMIETGLGVLVRAVGFFWERIMNTPHQANMTKLRHFILSHPDWTPEQIHKQVVDDGQEAWGEITLSMVQWTIKNICKKYNFKSMAEVPRQENDHSKTDWEGLIRGLWVKHSDKFPSQFEKLIENDSIPLNSKQVLALRPGKTAEPIREQPTQSKAAVKKKVEFSTESFTKARLFLIKNPEATVDELNRGMGLLRFVDFSRKQWENLRGTLLRKYRVKNLKEIVYPNGVKDLDNAVRLLSYCDRGRIRSMLASDGLPYCDADIDRILSGKESPDKNQDQGPRDRFLRFGRRPQAEAAKPVPSAETKEESGLYTKAETLLDELMFAAHAANDTRLVELVRPLRRYVIRQIPEETE